MSVRVLIADKVDQVLIDLLRESGFSVDYLPGISREDLLSSIRRYDVLVVRSRTRVDEEILRSGNLKVVARAGVGLDNIDRKTAQEVGVRIVNAPEAPVESVAELTIGMIIAAARRVSELNLGLRSGKWNKGLGMELSGKTLTLIGLGRIGRRVSEIARALGMRVVAYDVIRVDIKGVELVEDLEIALKLADVISLHVPLTDSTRHMINGKTIAMFRRGTILVNTSRGAVVDTRSVLRALNDGTISFYAADVLEHEPPRTEEEWALIRHPRALITPHIGSQTREAQRRIALMLAERIRDEVVHARSC